MLERRSEEEGEEHCERAESRRMGSENGGGLAEGGCFCHWAEAMHIVERETVSV